MCKLLSVFAGLLLAQPIFPSHADQLIAIYGWGSESCGRWLEVRRTGPGGDATLRQWVLGYVTAYNTFVAKSGDALKSADSSTIMVLVDRECTADPRMGIAPAVAATIRAEEAE